MPALLTRLLTTLHTRWILTAESLANLRGILRMFHRSKPPGHGEKSLVVCIRDFRHGRYGFLLVGYFAQAGYRIYFHRSLRFLLGLHGYDRAVLDIPNAGLFRRNLFSPASSASFLSLNAGPGQLPEGIHFAKRFVIDLDYFRTPAPAERTFRIPYHIHPLMQRHPFTPVRGLRRHRVLIYGQPDLEFAPELIRDHFGLHPRSEVFTHLDEGSMDWERPADYSALEAFLFADVIRPAACLIDSRRCWIPADQWLRVLSCFDFFIATPGVAMPHSHNMIEAMSMGTIPVTQYGRYLHPPLSGGVNCIAFTDLSDLDRQLPAIMTMPPAMIETLRDGVSDYVGAHIEPVNVIGSWEREGDPELRLLFNAEESSLALLRLRLHTQLTKSAR